MTVSIKWEPVVLSFSLSSKEMRGSDPLAHVRSRLEDLDVKTIIDYVIDQTTHVVSSKRNTAKGLQALVNGKYIVDDSFIDALVYAATPGDLENLESLSHLEFDFQSGWPDAKKHLPPPGKENIDRPSTAFAPDPMRLTIFEQYTFVFCDQSQFDNLQGPINNGQGKAHFFELTEGITTATEIVRFMKKAAGRHGVGNERHSSGGVVLVRFRCKGEFESWAIELGNEVALMTDQRVIEQREFLDAILGNDASPLCRPLPTEEISRPTPASQVQASQTSCRDVPSTSVSNSPVEPDTQPDPTKSLKSSAPTPRRRPYVSKMKTFDDGFDMESVPKYASEEEDTTIGDAQFIGVHNQTLSQPIQPVGQSKKESEEDPVADLLPGAHAMKRRRAEMISHHAEDNSPAIDTELPRGKRPKLDLLEAARKHREEEEQQQKIEQNIPPPSEDMDVNQLKNLAIVEEMEMPVRNAPTREGNIDRWDDQWNGRKNFKKFRRRSDTLGRARMQAVIVPLEEVTRKEYGIGDHYWSGNPRSLNVQSGTDDVNNVEESHNVPPSRSESLAPVNPSPERLSVPAPNRQKRARESRDSDSDDGTRFRFRRKR